MKFRLLIPILASLSLSVQAQAMTRTASGLPATSYSNMSWFLIAFELGPWDEYLLHELTPDLDRLTDQQSPTVSWLHLDEELIIPDFALSLDRPTRQPVVFSLLQQTAAAPMTRSGGSANGDPRRFEQSLFYSGVTRQVSDRSAVTVSAVLASQRYGATGMNLTETSDPVLAGSAGIMPGQRRSDVARGAGVRLALSSDVLSALRLEAAFQSRIEMSELATLQGVHGSRATLDIPSRIQLGLRFLTTDNTSFNVGVSQIFYSEVGAFPSRALPARFNALLGDSTSPQFNWDDLVVYNIGWQWQASHDLAFHFDYRTRSQPMPTARALADSLAPELAQNAFLAGVSKGLGQRSTLQINAAYAPPEFAFGGNVLGIVTDKLDQGFEVRANLVTRF